RDIGRGILADRRGPAAAGRWLGSGLGLAWRLQRGSVLGWAIGLFLGGLAYGSIGDDVGDLIGDGATAREMFAQAGSLVDGFYATAVLMLALIGSGFAISSALRPLGEEESGRTEALLATGLSRRRWLADQIVVTVAGSAVVLVGAGLGLGLGYALVTGDGGAIARLGAPIIAQLAPVLVLSGFARLLYGLAPRLLPLAWLLLGLCGVVMLFGELWRLPGWLRGLSPFDHLALVPAESFRWGPVLAVGAVAVFLSVAGQVAFSRRDIG
ncbi:MAG: polyketide antibiotic transporter, partial [Nocardioides sp.]